ncbi:MAG TPA: CsbD family protein [Solirubrobacteraceae bacterium]|nr:CsbD family protein [Solirubrobacteraceae bacterium]
MFKSARRDQTEGFIDRMAGKVLDWWGSITGSRSTKAKGKAAKGRGQFRSTRGKTKRAVR